MTANIHTILLQSEAFQKTILDKSVHDQYFVTTGTGAMPSKMAELGAGIAAEIADAGIDAVILTAT